MLKSSLYRDMERYKLYRKNSSEHTDAQTFENVCQAELERVNPSETKPSRSPLN
jgi:hypothetical protein